MPPSIIASRCAGLSIGLAIRPVTGLRKFPARCFPAIVRPRCGSLSPAGKAATSLEFITQREFHYARLCGKSGVIPKCRTVNVEIRVDAQRIEALGVAYVKYFPTQLQALSLSPRHRPTLGESHVDAEESGTAQPVALARFTGERFAERGIIIRQVGKDVHGSQVILLIDSSRLPVASLGAVPGKIPIRRPLKAIAHAKGEPASPAGQARELPPTDEGIHKAIHIVRNGGTTAERKIRNPVRRNLMGRIEI